MKAIQDLHISHDERGYHVLLDGVDLAPAIAAGGLRIEWVPGQEHPQITMTLRPSAVNAHLAEAVLTKVGELTQEEADAAVSDRIRQAAPHIGP